MSKDKAKSVEEFDKRFDEGESILALATVAGVSRPNLEPQRVNVDFPKHFLQRLDREAELRGVSRQALIKTWLYERLQSDANKSWPVGATIAGAGVNMIGGTQYAGYATIDSSGNLKIKNP